MITLHSATDRFIKRWPTTRSRQWLLCFLNKTREDDNIMAVVAVGSAVRSAVPSDDLDLVVICRDRRLLRVEETPIEVDLRAFDVGGIERDLQKGHDLLIWSVQYGQPLYDPMGVWAELARRWKGRLPMPDVSVARRRAEAARAQLEVMRLAGDENAIIDLNLSYLTHLARAALAEAGVFPTSRPELPDQLRGIGRRDLAERVEEALSARTAVRTEKVAV